MYERWIEKYRPQALSDLKGQETFKSAAKEFIRVGDIPHLLLYGETGGTGKTTAALILAREILGEYTNGNLIETNASDERSVEKMRGLVNKAVKYMPLGSKVKILLLDEADGLMKDAQWLLRRPLENSSRVRFILTANSLSAFIPQLVQRLMGFEFKLGREEIQERLKEIARNESLQISDIELERISNKAEGSLRTAINELQKMAITDDSISEIVQRYKP